MQVLRSRNASSAGTARCRSTPQQQEVWWLQLGRVVLVNVVSSSFREWHACVLRLPLLELLQTCALRRARVALRRRAGCEPPQGSQEASQPARSLLI